MTNIRKIGWVFGTVAAGFLAWAGLAEAQATKGQPVAKPAAQKPVAGPVVDPPFTGKYQALEFVADLKNKRSDVNSIFNGDALDATQAKTIEDYFTKWFFARWTDEKEYSSIPVYRRDFLMTNLSNAKGKVREHLLQVTLKLMTSLAKGDYAPVVRVNAALLIGDLISQRASTGGAADVPYALALPVLVDLVRDDKQIQSVKIAAMQGIVRHATLGVPAGDVRTALVAFLTSLVSTAPAANQQAQAQDWIRAEAAEALGALGEVGPNGSAAIALGRLAGDTLAALSARVAAAEALGKLDYQAAGAPKVDPIPLATALGQVALAECRTAKRYMSEGKPFEGVGRQLRTAISGVQRGFGDADSPKGVGPLAKEKAQIDAVEPIRKSVAALYAAAMDSKFDHDAAVKSVDAAIQALTPLVEKAKR